jgi:hypothetical protein
MVYSVKLFSSRDPDPLRAIPHWWKNFTRNNPPGQRFNREETNTRLLEYSASYVVMSTHTGILRRYVDFYDEKAYIWFVLRWS